MIYILYNDKFFAYDNGIMNKTQTIRMQIQKNIFI